ncbi:septum formation initiator family protein [Opitutales bacterium]|jgi:cell division protein FtsB|nr:septum formation initiator family protein [Opitutales bacterium]MDA8990841.1 septum formation initiator family protein [Opitutales bacterium]
MKQKKILLLFITVLGVIGGSYLMIQIKQALDEYYHWKSREAVLEKELDDLRQEVSKHRKFLEKLRTDPNYQEEIARKELGYGKEGEKLYRFPKDKIDINSNREISIKND